MRASKLEFQGKTWIRVDLPNNQNIASKISTISGACWNKSLETWLLPYNGISFRRLLNEFPEIEYPNKNHDSMEAKKSESMQTGIQTRGIDVIVLVSGRRIFVKLPKDENDVRFLRNIRYSRWDRKNFHWVVPNYPGNLDLIRSYFKNRIKIHTIQTEYQENTDFAENPTAKSKQLIMILTSKGRVKLIFGMNQELVAAIKNIPFHEWDPVNRWWTMPMTDRFCEEIRKAARQSGFEIIEQEEGTAKNKGLARPSRNTVVNYRNCPGEYILKLKELRYSEKTVAIYRSMFEEFINYYSKSEIERIDEKMIISFLRYLVMDRKVSESYQNQSINAIKFYYERVMGGNRKVYMVERPRRDKKLPVVLSETEVRMAIKSVTNLKHKAIMMVTYSGGLRISEVINLRIADIDSKRMQIFVRNAKGGKDRYTLLSKKVVPVLQEYYRNYRPKEWLFEGVAGGKYSEASIGAVVKKAFRNAGIKKRATTHTLRHCFATHLLENGTDIRYIQALLGHESSKTTEIYTHMTTKGFDQIVNPMDKFDI